MFNVYTRCKDGIHLVHANATYAETELYRAQSVNIEVFDVGCDPYEESRAKKAMRNLEAEHAAILKSELDYTRALADYHGAF